jgi:hypothetical protein
MLRLEMYAQLIVHRSLGIFRLVHYVSSNDIILLYNLLQVLQAIIIIFHSFLNYLEMNIIVTFVELYIYIFTL